MVNPNNKFAVIIAYYLARFNKQALQTLGYKSFNSAFEQIAATLNVKKNYVKLRRDEFDFIYPWRNGWQRPMHRQILRTIEAFQDSEEQDVREVVLEILNNNNFAKTEDGELLASIISDNITTNKKGKIRKSYYVLRGPTGRMAEDHFIKYFNKNKFPVSGILIDKREFGVGYDFEVVSSKRIYIEVKGLQETLGGILFTNKEWAKAQKEKNDYYLVIVKTLKGKPSITVLKNPASMLKPKKGIYSTVHVQWSVSAKQLQSISN